MRFLITLSYDGTNYKGYQSQPGMYTIQEQIEKALTKINNGKKSTVQYYNPLKRLMKGKPYVSEDGKEITKDMAEKYMNFLKSKIQEKKGEDINEG